MPIDKLKEHLLSPSFFEGLAILAIAPWLLFPSQSPLITVIALVAAALLWLWPWVRRKAPLEVTPFNVALLLFELFILVGIIVTADPLDSLPKATGLVLGLTTWHFIIQRVRDKSAIFALTFVFILAGLGFIVFGVLGANWPTKVPLLDGILRLLPSRLIVPPGAPSEGVHSNQLASILIFYLPLVFSLAIGWRPAKRQKLALAILIALVTVTGALLILSQSRSGWIGGLFGVFAVLLLWAVTLRPSRKRSAIQLSLVVLILLGAVVLVSIGPDRMQNIWEEPAQTTAIGSLGTINFRVEVWRWALTGIRDFPFTGTGLGSFRHVVQRLYPIDINPNFDIAHAHNIFLQTSLDIGLPGLIAYISILLVAFAAGWQTAKKNPELRPLAIGLFASIFALHVFGMTDVLALGSKPGLLFWIALGLLAAAKRLTHLESPKPDLIEPTVQESIQRA